MWSRTEQVSLPLAFHLTWCFITGRAALRCFGECVQNGSTSLGATNGDSRAAVGIPLCADAGQGKPIRDACTWEVEEVGSAGWHAKPSAAQIDS